MPREALNQGSAPPGPWAFSRVVTGPGKAAAFAAFCHHTAIPLMQHTAGIVILLPGAARPGSPRAFRFVMIRESVEALKAFVGEDHDSPHIDPDEAEPVARRTIRHHDLVGT